MHQIYLQRVGEPPLAASRRVLADRLWPRGIRKEDADWNDWLKDIAPSKELRMWYAHDSARRAEFRARYRAELADDAHRADLERLRALAMAGSVTLLTFSRSVEESQLPVLRSEVLGEREDKS
ncbi:MAG: DUF488 family protein [Thermaerobacter sp.]|nr:DUF488 family protein [Thermaerobacter sp.]